MMISTIKNDVFLNNFASFRKLYKSLIINRRREGYLISPSPGIKVNIPLYDYNQIKTSESKDEYRLNWPKQLGFTSLWFSM